jgi:hypothetical protein
LIRVSASDGRVRCTASDGRCTPARPASQVRNTRLRTCCAGRAGPCIRSEALHRVLTFGRLTADRAGARPYHRLRLQKAAEFSGVAGEFRCHNRESLLSVFTTGLLSNLR